MSIYRFPSHFKKLPNNKNVKNWLNTIKNVKTERLKLINLERNKYNIGYGFCGQWGNMPCNISLGLYESGEEITIRCKWDEPGNYTMRVCAIDCNGCCSDFAIVEIQMKKSFNFYDMFLSRLIQHFPILECLL